MVLATSRPHAHRVCLSVLWRDSIGIRPRDVTGWSLFDRNISMKN